MGYTIALRIVTIILRAMVILLLSYYSFGILYADMLTMVYCGTKVCSYGIVTLRPNTSSCPRLLARHRMGALKNSQTLDRSDFFPGDFISQPTVGTLIKQQIWDETLS
jgi:hypothetical protein